MAQQMMGLRLASLGLSGEIFPIPYHIRKSNYNQYATKRHCLLKSNILDGPATTPRGWYTAPTLCTEPLTKRTWPAENVLGVSSSVTTKTISILMLLRDVRKKSSLQLREVLGKNGVL